jgi:hypothetical protein
MKCTVGDMRIASDEENIISAIVVIYMADNLESDADRKPLIPPESVANRIRSEYMHASMNPDIKQLESLKKLVYDCQTAHVKLNTFLNAAAQFIYRQLNIHNLSIGIWDPVDKKFRYIAFAGMRKQMEDTLRGVTYARVDFLDSRKYPSYQISKYTRLFLAENNPYAPGEEESYNRPLMLTQSRTTNEDTIEGDYLDIMIMDIRNEIIGWIEISGTKQGKLPDSSTIYWLELVGSIIGLVLTTKDLDLG